ncbi:hypothetical protein EVJ58_g4212 [Rhodofomes roseus]|uniref:Uncharacterized protein n=1 Tax=Rhodofomes roseus TaxID=34475 RepID=A0A4Y9YH53_9APHY|nr:hypothetical protein EVJ58_g4212 [Rhodofomes roseus]
MAEVDTFGQPSSLLVPSESLDRDLGDPGYASVEDPFVLNGLLGGCVTGRDDADHETRETQAAEPMEIDGSGTHDSELPEVTEILRPYARTESSILAAASSSFSSASTSYIVRASNFDGKSVLLKRRPRRTVVTTGVTVGAPGPGQQKFSNLLEVPIHRLLEQLSTDEAIRLSRSDAEAVAAAQQSSRGTTANSKGSEDNALWVDRYAPKRFTDLLVARHAGYEVFEINASDARSAQVVDDRLRPALESGSAVGSSKPVLVVIDEIDGATGGSDHSAGFVRKLLSLTYDRPKKKGRKADPKASRPLLRPIICICNDLYATALRDLRTSARVVRFSRPNDIHLVRRLREICDTEGLRAESRALTALVGIAQGDLRGCLNMLQLIKAKGREVTEPVVRTAAAGMKQVDMTSTSVLNDLFSPMARKRTKDLGLTEEDEARVAEGCFEYYATCHRHDANFARYLKAAEWLTSYDVLSGEMWTEREFALAEYLPFMFVGFYPLFQERGRPKLERPKATWDHHVATTTNQEIYASLARCLRSAAARNHGDYRHLANGQILQLEFAPYLNRLISPPLNPIDDKLAAMRSEPTEKNKPKRSNFFKQRAINAGADDDTSLPAAKRSKQDHIGPAEKAAVDFFGRPIIASTAKASSGKEAKIASTKTVTKYNVAYRFNEGNSAAVRKPIKVSAFL